MSASGKHEDFDEVEVAATAPTSARRSRYDLAAGEGRDAGAKATEEESAAGPAVEIVFCLPDGTVERQKVGHWGSGRWLVTSMPKALTAPNARPPLPPVQFPVGQDVAYLKAYLHRTHDLAVDKQV